jgi:hypothetical protein
MRLHAFYQSLAVLLALIGSLLLVPSHRCAMWLGAVGLTHCVAPVATADTALIGILIWGRLCAAQMV